MTYRVAINGFGRTGRDVVGDPSSCVIDGALTQAAGRMVKVFGWYDNEGGYTNRLVDLTELLARPEGGE